MRDLLWDCMLDTDMNVRYWGYLTRRYTAYDRNLKIFLALMSSGVVASWSFWSRIDILWKILSGLSACTAIALPILNWQKTIEITSTLKGKWVQIKNEYEMLWVVFNNKSKGLLELETKLRRIKDMENDAAKMEGHLSQDRKLILRCQDEVEKARGVS